MSKYRELTTKNDYYIPREDYLTAIHYSRRYPLLVAELEDALDTSTAIRYDKDPVQVSPSDDMIVNAAIKASEIRDRIELIDAVIHECANGLDHFLRLGVCYGLTFDELKGKKMPCERTAYYTMRRRYYYELIKKI